MQENAIETLNSLLKGEQMAMEAYQRFINDTDDIKVKAHLEQILENHRENSEMLVQRIEELGGEPDFSVGISGKMSEIRLAVQDAINGAPVQILKRAYDGEDKGIAMAEKVVKTELDPESREVVEKVLSTDHDHLKSMANLINRYEEGREGNN